MTVLAGVQVIMMIIIITCEVIVHTYLYCIGMDWNASPVSHPLTFASP